MTFNGLGVHLGNLSLLSDAASRSISAENFTGEKGKGGMSTDGIGAPAARELGQGWKVSPCIRIEPFETVTIAEIDGPGAIQHIWLTVHPTWWRRLVWRIYWDDEETPSVETPLGDFFGNGWCERCNISSLPLAVNPAGGFNSYWEMPFRKRARITVENLSPDPVSHFFYQVDYALTSVPDEAAYFHAQWRRSNPLAYKDVHTLLDGVVGQGHYVGTYMPGASTTPAGGVRARSSSISTAMESSRPSAEPAPKTTLVAPGTSSTRKGSTVSFRRRSLACHR